MKPGLATLLMSSVLVLLAACEDHPKGLASLGTLEVDRIDLVADSSEPIVEVLVTEGDAVQAGDVLVRQDAAKIRAARKRARAELALAKARLSEAESGPRAQEIAAARAQVAAATSDVKTARVELERERTLVKQNYSSQNNVDILEGRFEAAIARQQEAEARLSELLEGTRSEEIDAARSNFAVAEAQLEDIEISMRRTEIMAPVAGKIEAVIHEIGERPQPGTTVIVLLRDQLPYARVHVPEPLRTRLEHGSRAQIYIDGHTAPLAGRLRWIAHDASFTPYFALTQKDRSHLSYLAEVEVAERTTDVPAVGVPVEVYFPEVQSDAGR